MLKKEPHQGYTEFFIFAEKEIGLLQAFRALTEKLSDSNFSRKTAQLSELAIASDVKSYFKAWGWEMERDSLGNIQDIAQVAVDMETAVFMLKAIAPFVSPGSFVILHGDVNRPGTHKLCFEETGLTIRQMPEPPKKGFSTSALIEEALELVNKAAAIAANNRGSMAAPSSLEAALETARASLVEASRFDVT